VELERRRVSCGVWNACDERSECHLHRATDCDRDRGDDYSDTGGRYEQGRLRERDSESSAGTTADYGDGDTIGRECGALGDVEFERDGYWHDQHERDLGCEWGCRRERNGGNRDECAGEFGDHLHSAGDRANACNRHD
jgi:hypothetical protein